MRIESLQVWNFKAFKHLHLRDVPRFCVIVGSNGSGKSTLFSVFAFLKDALANNVYVALTRLGGSRGFEEVRTRGCTGPIRIELKFRESPDKPLVTYDISIGLSEGRPIVEREVLKYRRGSSGKPWHFLDFRHGQGEAVQNEPDRVESEAELRRESFVLKSPDLLAVKGLAQFERFPASKALGTLIERWQLSDFHVQRARSEQEARYAEHLSPEGENLPLVVQYLHQRHPGVFAQILAKLAHRVPGISNVDAKETEEGKVLLRFRDDAFQEPFIARHVSDGTIKMLAYLVLLHDPDPHPLLCVEEPENQLHPHLLVELAEEFRSYAERGGQVFVSTHSPDFLNAVELDELFWLVKAEGYSTAVRARDDEQVRAYCEAGDPLGQLWKEGFFKGADPQ